MAKRNVFISFTYNGEELHGQVDFQRSTRKGNKVLFAVAVGTAPTVTIDIVTGMNWDYTFTNSYSVKTSWRILRASKSSSCFQCWR